MKNVIHFKERREIHLIDGRTLSYYEAGPKDGVPILFCTGAAMAGSLGFGLDIIDDLGAYLIAIDRPGLGHSTAHPNKTLISWVDDVNQLVKELKLVAPKAVGFSQGAVFAFALAASKLVSSIAIVSGHDDFNDKMTKSLLSQQVVPFISMIQSKNSEFINHFTSTVKADEFLNFILSMSSIEDKEFYSNEVFFKYYLESLSLGLQQGAESYVQDLVNAMAEWPFKLEDISHSVQLWYGGQDASTVHSPDFGKRMSQRLSHAERYYIDDAGGSLLWTHSRDILEKLLKS